MAHPIRVLLVEDNPADIELAREGMELSKFHCDLEVCVDGAAALEHLQAAAEAERLPDLVLLDLNLPKLSGREVLAHMRQDPALRRIPVVVLSSSQAESDILGSYDLGANCYIQKPVDFDRFVRIVACIEEFWFTVVKLPSR